MVDLDYIDRIDFQLRVASTYMDNETELLLSADDGDKAAVFTIRGTEDKSKCLSVVADKKAARLVVNFFQTYFDL